MNRITRSVLHPFLLSAYPVLALLAYNIRYVALVFALRPLLFSMGLASISLLLFRLVFKDWRKAALAATLTSLLFFTYGHVYNLIEGVQVAGINIGRHRTLVPLWIILFGTGLWFISRKDRNLQAWTQALNLVAGILFVIPVVKIGIYEIHSVTASQMRQAETSPSMVTLLKPEPNATRPDIYYIILDTYTRADALQKAFNYDNTAFIQALEQRGFYVAECSQSNYSFTAPSLTSSLDMQYLPDLSNKFTLPNTDASDLYPYLQNNAVRATLKDMGYQIVSFTSGYSPTEFRDADMFFSPQSDMGSFHLTGGLSPFEAILLRTTVGSLLYDARFYLPGEASTLLDSAYILHRDRMLYAFDKLMDVPLLPGPKFIFVHILAPHNPFVFGPNGEAIYRNTPFTLDDDLSALRFTDYVAGFTDQVTYINTRVLQTVDAIIRKSRTLPVIIIQGDHGSPRTPEWKTAILNAYYLPGGNENLYPSISPVNSFRVIFNTYFDGHLPLLADRACRSSLGDPFNCTYQPDPNPVCNQP